MDSTPNPKQADPHLGDNIVALGPPDLAAAETALTKAEDALGKLAHKARSVDADRPLGATRADFSAGPRVAAASLEAIPPPRDIDKGLGRPDSGRGRPVRSLFRFLLAIGIGVAATLAWQSHGDTARQMIAISFPALGWLSPPRMAPPPDALTEPASRVAVQANVTNAAPAQPAAPARPTPDPVAPVATVPPALVQQIETMARDLAAVRQGMEQLTIGHEQMSRTLARLHAAEEDLRHKQIPPPRPPVARKPAATLAPPPSSLQPMTLPPPRPVAQPSAPPSSPAIPLRPPGSMP
jgi:hypothetical protein